MRMYNISNHPVETSFKFNFKGFGGFREATGRVLVAAEKKKEKKNRTRISSNTRHLTHVSVNTCYNVRCYSPHITRC